MPELQAASRRQPDTVITWAMYQVRLADICRWAEIHVPSGAEVSYESPVPDVIRITVRDTQGVPPPVF